GGGGGWGGGAAGAAGNRAEPCFAARPGGGQGRRAVPEQRDVWLRAALQQLRGSLGDQVPRRGVGARYREPLGVLTFLGTPVDVGTGEEIRAITLHRSLPRSRGCAGDSNPAGVQFGVIQPVCAGTVQ